VEDSYQRQRRHFLGHIKQMLDETRHSPWSIIMQHESCDTKHIIDHTNLATRDMVKAFKTMIGYLEEDHPLESLIDYKNLPCYTEYNFSNSAKDDAASALLDTALLIVSFDPSTFFCHAPGRMHSDLIQHLNGTLHLWLSRIHHQWQLFRDDSVAETAPLLKEKIPPPEREKATLSTAFKAVCHALHIGPEKPSPFINEAAISFEKQFKVKLWPSPTPPNMKRTDDKCHLVEISTLFQEWYFSVGKTQITETSPKASHEAEDIFVKIRSSMHEKIRTCDSGQESTCQGNCPKEIFSETQQHPFAQKCINATAHITRNFI
jgi:hypothetical protein